MTALTEEVRRRIQASLRCTREDCTLCRRHAEEITRFVAREVLTHVLRDEAWSLGMLSRSPADIIEMFRDREYPAP